ncbi:major facilitator superfamily domain-containing protein [Suillus ampliporus]|nr:major facilitator superfamily domain-containing protein [Suillus ampliporus]
MMSAHNVEKSADPTDVIDESSSGVSSDRARRDLERRLVRKLDLRMSVIVVLNVLNYVDRTNASARLAGFEKDLHLQGKQYATVLSIVYVGYILMQLPGNMLLHWLERPAILIPASMAIWGVVSGLTGITKKWLFYIEGGATVLVAISAIFILPDFPHNTRWLTPEERALAISRLTEDGYGRVDVLGKRTTMQGLWDAVSDWKVWWLSFALIIHFVALSFAIYFPTIVSTMGYDTTVTLLLSAPPWVLATITSFALSRYSDKKRERFMCFFVSCATAALGFVVSMCTMNMGVRYFSMFLMAQIAAGQMVLWGWINNMFAREPAKRAAAIAVINGLSQTGNIIGSFVWPSNWGPTYRYSYAVCFAALAVSTGMFGAVLDAGTAPSLQAPQYLKPFSHLHAIGREETVSTIHCRKRLPAERDVYILVFALSRRSGLRSQADVSHA